MRQEALSFLLGRLELLSASAVEVSSAKPAAAVEDETKLDVGGLLEPQPLASAGTGSHLIENFRRCLLPCRLLAPDPPGAVPTSWLAA